MKRNAQGTLHVSLTSARPGAPGPQNADCRVRELIPRELLARITSCPSFWIRMAKPKSGVIAGRDHGWHHLQRNPKACSSDADVDAKWMLPSFLCLFTALLLGLLLKLFHQRLHFHLQLFGMTLDVDGPGANIEWQFLYDSALWCCWWVARCTGRQQ